MLQALLRGKLSRQQENMEDVLTSNVFGLFQYIPACEGILPFLAQAEASDGTRPLAWLNDPSSDVHVTPEDLVFWPKWREDNCIPCEPDVVVHIHHRGGRDLLILVEAKYLSGKSSEADEMNEHPNDQLAREWDNLVRIANRKDAEPYLVYLTAGIGFPRVEIEESIRDYRQRCSGEQVPPRMLASSWRQISEIFKQSDHPILKDLCKLMDRFGLTYFVGFTNRFPTSEIGWSFQQTLFRWDSFSVPSELNWRFER